MSRLLDLKDRKTGKFPFVYIPAAKTDLAATFARLRREQAKQIEAERAIKVRQIKQVTR